METLDAADLAAALAAAAEVEEEEERPREPFNIFVKTFTSKTLTVELYPGDELDKVILSIEQQTSIAESAYYLTYCNRFAMNTDLRRDIHLGMSSWLNGEPRMYLFR
jgi:hypothetical protein